MSLYSTIDRRSVNADKAFRSVCHDAQLLWFRLLTGAHVTSVPGLWTATESGLASAFGFELSEFRNRFAELNEAGLTVEADWETGVIWIPLLMTQACAQPRNSNVVNGWVYHLELVPDCELRDRGIKALRGWVTKATRSWKGSPLKFLNFAEELIGNISERGDEGRTAAAEGAN